MADPEQQAYAPLAPYLMVDRGHEALAFYKQAFGAEITEQYDDQDGAKLGHATLRINGGELMVSDEWPEEITGVRSPKSLGGTTSTITLAVDDADRWFERATRAGAEVVRPLADEFYGRMGKVRDPFGHTWGILGPTKR